jgi:uncharacterized protein (DUF305 family)
MPALWNVVVMILTVGVFSVLVKPVAANEPAPRTATARYEIGFMEDMIDHHMMAVLMARLCENRQVHEELLMLCQQIEATQTAEIEEMQAWLEDWYGISYEPHMTKRMQRQLEELASLAGAEFEIAFTTMMIGHHETAVTEGERCVERAYHRGLIELCEDIVVTQSMEIAVMEGWLCEWYDICDDE